MHHSARDVWYAAAAQLIQRPVCRARCAMGSNPRECAQVKGRSLAAECAHPRCTLHAASIPKGLCPPAQGCELASYPGKKPWSRLNPNGVVSPPDRWRVAECEPQPRWGCCVPTILSQGSSSLATLGFEAESLWDSPLLFSRSKDGCKVQRGRAHSRTLSLLLFTLASFFATATAIAAAPESLIPLPVRGTMALNQPVAVYNNWSAYDELSDNIELTEKLAMKELGEILRLRRAGVRIDYYMMDAFWYSPTGGYFEFRRPQLPRGAEGWLRACRRTNIKPGLGG